MPSSMTKVDVYNMAIDIIRDTALQSTTDPAATARWLNRNWQPYVEAAMRAYPWNFAKQQFKLPADSEKPLFKWSYFYTPPPGWLRVLPITTGGRRDGRPVPHEIIGQRIATNYPAPLPVTCIMDRTANPGQWDTLFVQFVAAKLALGMTAKFPAKARYTNEAKDALAAATEQAEQIDAYEGSAEPVEENNIIRARGLGQTYLPRE